MDKLLTVEEAAAILRVSKATLRFSLPIPCIRIGGAKHRRYREEDIQKYMDENREE